MKKFLYSCLMVMTLCLVGCEKIATPSDADAEYVGSWLIEGKDQWVCIRLNQDKTCQFVKTITYSGSNYQVVRDDSYLLYWGNWSVQSMLNELKLVFTGFSGSEYPFTEGGVWSIKDVTPNKLTLTDNSSEFYLTRIDASVFEEYFKQCINIYIEELSDTYLSEWEGEYISTDVITFITQDGNEDYSISRQFPITIFRDNGLFVQTYNIGDPFYPETDPITHTIPLRVPARMPAAAYDDENGEIPEPSGIETIEAIEVQGTRVVIINGSVYTVSNGIIYAPKAIPVHYATKGQLVLTPGKPFEIKLMSDEDVDIGTYTMYWTYTPIRKIGDTYTWEAELRTASRLSSSTPEILHVRHTITMTKQKSESPDTEPVSE